MKFTQLSEISEMSDGAVVEGIRGTVAQVYKRREGQGEFGPYSYQTLQLTDGELKVTVEVGNKENMVALKGKHICILSGRDGKGKLSGIMVVDSEYNGNVKRVLKTNKNAEFTEHVPASELQAPSEPLAEAHCGESAAQKLLRERRELAPRVEPPPPPISTKKPATIHSPKGRLAQRAHLLLLCRKAVWLVAKECLIADERNVCGADALQAMTTTLYISAEREGLDRDLAVNFTSNTPPSPPKSLPPPPPPPPPPVEEDDIPF